MNYALNIPQKFKFKRFYKRYAKISKVSETYFNQVRNNTGFICGIKCLEGGFLTQYQLHRHILLLRRAIGKGRQGWSRLCLFLNVRCPITKKSSGHRMGKGKGAVRFWGVPIRKGSFLFKIKSSSFKYRFMDSISWSFIYAVIEFLEVYEEITITTSRYKNIRKYFSFVKFLQDVKQFSSVISVFRKFFRLKQQHLRVFLRRRKGFRVKSRSLRMRMKKKKKRKIKKFVLHPKGVRFLIYQFADSIIGRTTQMTVVRNKTNILSIFLGILWARIRRKVVVPKNWKRSKRRRLRFGRFYHNLCRNLINNRFNKIMDLSDIPEESSIKDFDVAHIESKVYLERIKKYKNRPLSRLPSLYRGLYRVKKKLPFKSEIIFFSEKPSIYFELNTKRKVLKHKNQR